MENKVLNFFIISFISMLAVGILYVLCMEVPNKEVVAPGNTSNCNHEFVITSEYDWFHSSYKTISRCIHCGKEV